MESCRPGLVAARPRRISGMYVLRRLPARKGAGRSLIGERTRPFSRTEIPDRLSGKASAWHLDGTPALVVRHAFSTVLRDRKIDLAISGINYGENIGYDISNSGTVGAAMECARLGAFRQ